MLLYRFTDLAGLIDLVVNRRMYLRQVMAWEDPYETNTVTHLVQDIFKRNAYHATPKSGEVAVLRVKLLAAIVEHAARSVYAQSWSVLPESDALWRIYSPDKRGTRLAVQHRILLASMEAALPNVNCFRVEYCSPNKAHTHAIRRYQEGGYQLFLTECCRYKRSEFEHEREYRFCFVESAKGESGVNPDDARSLRQAIERHQRKAKHSPSTREYSFDPAKVEHVTFDPRLDAIKEQWYVDAVRKLCQMGGIHETKLNQSNLYRIPTNA